MLKMLKTAFYTGINWTTHSRISQQHKCHLSVLNRRELNIMLNSVC